LRDKVLAFVSTRKWRWKKNMASSSEAFERFSTWKNLNTSLRVTVIENGETKEVVTVTIFGVDSSALQVGIVSGTHKYVAFDVEGAAFSIEPTRLIATRNESDWLIFEELS
jgi:VCBS repeat-containing protein